VYQNEEGRVSRRRVEIVRWSHARNSFTYLRAFCYLREEERTFRGDRIVEWRVVERDGPVAPRPAVVFVPTVPPRAPAAASPVGPAAWAPPRTSVASAPVAASFPPPAPSRRRSRGVVTLLGVAVAIVLVRGLSTTVEPSTPAYVPAPPPPAVVPSPRPAPKPAPGLVPEPPAADILTDDRASDFRAATGIASPQLEAIYRGADRDGDDALDWDELSAFQSRLDRTYAYRSNALALRPDQFLAQGGGNCEDWALFSCGLLRFWGWDPYVGSFAPSEHAVGHAVCLARVTGYPSRFSAWTMDGDGTLGGYSVKAGKYVPVDYDHVGELSNAVGDGWRLRAIWRPEAIYGEAM
jgi:hypothetical protein